MSTLFSSSFRRDSIDIPERATVPNATTTIVGNTVIWDLTEPTAARVLTLRSYDKSDSDNYYWAGKKQLPIIVVRCAVDCSSYEFTVKDDDGTPNTLYTFTEDRSSTPIYVAFKKSATTNLWVLA